MKANFYCSLQLYTYTIYWSHRRVHHVGKLEESYVYLGSVICLYFVVLLPVDEAYFLNTVIIWCVPSLELISVWLHCQRPRRKPNPPIPPTGSIQNPSIHSECFTNPLEFEKVYYPWSVSHNFYVETLQNVRSLKITNDYTSIELNIIHR